LTLQKLKLAFLELKYINTEIITDELIAETRVPQYKEENRNINIKYGKSRRNNKEMLLGYHQLCYVDRNMELGPKEKK
jgi:hypothetical protein